MLMKCANWNRGYTIVELMVTLVIIATLAATVGTFFVKLLTIQEREREEGYVREKLVDICGAYADFLSIASSIAVSNRSTFAEYRRETGGVSLETGTVTRVSHIETLVDLTNRTLSVDVYSNERGRLARKMARTLSGDAALIPLAGDMVSLRVQPLNVPFVADGTISRSTAALGYLEARASYATKDEWGDLVTNTVTAGRVVRLWNRE